MIPTLREIPPDYVLAAARVRQDIVLFMSDMQCARCDRMEPPQEAVDGAEEDSLIPLLGGAWASIDGEGVCPQHQTPAERRDLASQIVAAVEKEIDRNAELDPSPVEPGLVLYAMQLREALAAADKNHLHLDVAITGAFLTGCPMRIGVRDYVDVQRKLATKLSERTQLDWMTSVEQRREGTYESGGGFSDQLPLVLVSCDGAAALARAKAVLRARPKDEQDWLDGRTQGWIVKPSSMRIEVYDLGVAVINGTFGVDLPAEETLDAAARKLKEIVWLRPEGADEIRSPIAEMFRQLSDETTREFRASVKATTSDWPPRPWLPTTDPEKSTEWGRLLWLHPVHMLTSTNPELRKSSAKELAPAFSKSVDVPDGRFVPGVGWSAIVTDDHTSARVMPLKLVHLHWAYFALYMEIDRGLLLILDRDELKTKRPLLSESEEHAKEAFDDYLRVMKARARVDTALASLGGDEQAIWDVIADVQNFDKLVAGVDRKVEVLQKIADRRVQEATAAATRRSAIILGLLTTLTLVTLATTLISYFLGGLSDNDDHFHLRWSILGLGVLFAILLWAVTFQVRPWHWWKRRNRQSSI
jgi:hypothetical protein